MAACMLDLTSGINEVPSISANTIAQVAKAAGGEKIQDSRAWTAPQGQANTRSEPDFHAR